MHKKIGYKQVREGIHSAVEIRSDELYGVRRHRIGALVIYLCDHLFSELLDLLLHTLRGKPELEVVHA